MRVGIVAGEASGDLLGSKLIYALREHNANVIVEGVAGPAMLAAGCRGLFDIERLSVMGLIEPLLHLPDLWCLRRDIYQHFLQNPPDVFIGIDAPDFNLGLEIKLRRAGIPVVHYVSPSVWAWRQSRIHKIKKAVDMMLTLLPFEAKFYEQHDVPVRYVGHPLAEQIPLVVDTIAAKNSLKLDVNATYIALLPGSRKQEIHYNAEPMLQAAKMMYQKNPALRFFTSHINQDRADIFCQIHQQVAPEIPITLFVQRTHEVMAAANVIVVASGTATLEAMLFKKPMVIVYKMSPITYQLAKWLVKTPHIGLPNLLSNQMVVPELIQHQATPENIAKAVLEFVADPGRIGKINAHFAKLHQELRQDSNKHVYEAILQVASMVKNDQ